MELLCYTSHIHFLCSSAVIIDAFEHFAHTFKKMYADTDFRTMEVSGENYLINCSLI